MISRFVFSLLFVLIFFDNYSLSNDEKSSQIKDESLKTNTMDKSAKDSKVKCELELLDRIESEVTYLGSDNLCSNIVTKQEIERRGFDGNIYSVEDLENQDLADQFSKVLKANVTNDDINRNLKKNGMTERDICNIAEKWGYLSKDDFFEDLKKIYRASSAMNYEVDSCLVASQENINAYYKQHIDEFKQETKYSVETAFIPYSNNNDDTIEDNNEKLRSELNKYIKSKTAKPEYVIWDLAVVISQHEITADNEFLTELSNGDMCMKESEAGFILYKLKNKQLEHTLPVEEVKENIIIKLKSEKYPSVIKQVQEKLRSQAIIVRPNIIDNCESIQKN